MALLTILLSSFLLAFSGAMMPGPLLTATIGESARRGALSGPLLILGHSALEFVMLLALLFGLAPLLRHDGVFAAIALVGAAILLWMAGGMFRSLPRLSLDIHPAGSSSGPLVTNGILLSVANPYWAIWWATIGLGYLASCQAFGLPGIAAFFFGHISGDLVWYSFVSILIAKGRHLLSDRVYRGLIGFCATFLAVFALGFVYVGLKRLMG